MAGPTSPWPVTALATSPSQPERKFEEIAITAGLGYSKDGAARAGMRINAVDIKWRRLPDIAISNFESKGSALF
jgi:hypothetical protein